VQLLEDTVNKSLHLILVIAIGLWSIGIAVYGSALLLQALNEGVILHAALAVGLILIALVGALFTQRPELFYNAYKRFRKWFFLRTGK
jgi:hypothetical protein